MIQVPPPSARALTLSFLLAVPALVTPALAGQISIVSPPATVPVIPPTPTAPTPTTPTPTTPAVSPSVTSGLGGSASGIVSLPVTGGPQIPGTGTTGGGGSVGGQSSGNTGGGSGFGNVTPQAVASFPVATLTLAQAQVALTSIQQALSGGGLSSQMTQALQQQQAELSALLGQ